MGCFIRIKIIFRNNKLMENYEIPNMDSLLVLIDEFLYLMNHIVAHARECHKASYDRFQPNMYTFSACALVSVHQKVGSQIFNKCLNKFLI